jgi:hypothetical protein
MHVNGAVFHEAKRRGNLVPSRAAQRKGHETRAYRLGKDLIFAARPARGLGQARRQDSLVVATGHVELRLGQAGDATQINPFKARPIEIGTGKVGTFEIGTVKNRAR